MNEIKENYNNAMKDVYHILGKYDYEHILRYVEKLERENFGLKTTVENLKRKVAKDYECIPYR